MDFIEALTGLVAVLGTFSIPLYVLKRRYDLKQQKIALQLAQARGQNLLAGQDPKIFEERLQALEGALADPDRDLNRRFAELEKRETSVLGSGSNPT